MAEAKSPRTRLVLITPVVDDAMSFASVLGDTCRAADVAAVIVRLPAGDDTKVLAIARGLAAPVQASGAALLLADRPGIVGAAAADGAHFSSPVLLQSTMPSLAPGRIAGAAGLASRHDAMSAAEGNVDYVMFGEPDENGKRPGFSGVVERVSWWAEIFKTPCVAFAGSMDEVAQLSEAGADFVALGETIWNAPDGAVAAIKQAATHLNAAEPVQ